MICPYCNQEINDACKRCPRCGATLENSQATRGYGANSYAAQTASGTGLLFGAAARAARANTPAAEGEIISDRMYNGTLLIVLLWGLLVNFILCSTVHDLYEHINPIVFLIGYVVLAIIGIIIANKSQNPWISFLGYNMIVVPFGLMLSTVIEAYGGIDSAIVRDAFLYTLLISTAMCAAAIAFPKLFEKLGGALLACLFGMIILEVVLLIFRKDNQIVDWIAAGIFSLYIGYDVYRSQQYPKTFDNAVDSAIDVYLDVANLFIRLLAIMARSKRDD